MKKIDNWGQNILIPTKDEWSDILKAKKISGCELSKVCCDFAEEDLVCFKNSPEVILGLVDQPGRYYYLRLLEIEGVLHRVHFEDVICEHCNKRSGMSASPDIVSYAGATKKNEAKSAVWAVPVMSCIHCNGKLNRRHTIWMQDIEQCAASDNE